VGIFSFFKKKPFFSAKQQEQIVQAIRLSEKTTSGEIRIFIESKNPFVNPIDRASEIFFKLKMQHTEHRNAVLLYVAMMSREVALFADEGIHKEVGDEYWGNAVKKMVELFKQDNITKGIEECVLMIGQTLTEKFPYNSADDKNELPDDIVFGK